MEIFKKLCLKILCMNEFSFIFAEDFKKRKNIN